MEARMKNVIGKYPNVLKALREFTSASDSGGVAPSTLEFIHLRASQINGCSVCVVMHAHGLKKLGESDDRIFAVAAWRDAPFFTDAERAALALTEAATRISDRPDPVSDEIWDEAAKYYSEDALAQLLVHIAGINVWNRFNAATRQVAMSGQELEAMTAGRS